MHDLITEEEELFHLPLLNILQNPYYENTRFKLYRALCYTLLTGCICAKDVYTLFLSPDDLPDTNDFLSNKTKFQSYLSRMANTKNAYLVKEKKDYYTITQAGIECLTDHILQNQSISPDFVDYLIKCRKKLKFFDHANVCGNCLHSFSKHNRFSFAIEPALDISGKRNTTDYAKAYLYPDALLHLDHSNEYVFIEADMATEQLHAALIPKFQRYANILGLSLKNGCNATIHFVIKSKADKEPHLEAEYRTLYDFISSFGINEAEFIQKLEDYSGANDVLCRLSRNIEKVKTFSYHSKTKGINYSSSFLKRKELCQRIIQELPSLQKVLEMGCRFIISPHEEDLKIIKNNYFNEHNNELIKRILSKLGLCEPSQYLSLKKFSSCSKGNDFYFRNVYFIKSSEKTIHLCIENITDDLGARIRIQNFIDNEFYRCEENIYIACIVSSLIGIENFLNQIKTLNQNTSYAKIFIIKI